MTSKTFEQWLRYSTSLAARSVGILCAILPLGFLSGCFDATLDVQNVASSFTGRSNIQIFGAASYLGWLETSPTNVVNVTARWTRSSSITLTNQMIQFYAGSACDAPIGAMVDLVSSALQSYPFPGAANGSVYTFRVSSVDSVLGTLASPCSSPISIDMTAPTVTINQGIGQADPASALPINFDIAFSEQINPATFSVASISLSGTATGVTLGLSNHGDDQHFTLHVLSASNGTIIPGIAAGMVSDRAGNLNSAATFTDNSVSYDNTPPAVPGAPVLFSPASSPSSNTTPAYTISGVFSGDTVRLYTSATCASSGLVGTSVSAGASVTVTSAALPDGSYQFYANSTDPAGNASSCSAGSSVYQVDTTSPARASALALITPATSPGSVTTPTIQVSGLTSGDTVQLHGDSACTTLKASGVATGASINLTSSALGADGNYLFYAKVIDAAGNSLGCSSASVSYQLDTTAPAKASSLALATPASSPGNVTTPTIQINGLTSGDTIQLHSDSACTTLRASGVAAGTSINLTSSALSPDGTYNFYAKVIDSAGNSLGCSTAFVAYQLDTTAPAKASSLALFAPTASPGNVTAPTIQINGLTAGDSIQLHADSGCTTLKASGVATGASINLTSSALPADGSYVFYAKVIDSVGNTLGCSTASVSYQLDTTAPALASSLALFSPTVSPSNVTTPTIQINGVSSGDTVQLHANSTCTLLKASGTSTGASINLTSSALSPDGTYTFYAKTIDPAGNTLGCSSASIPYQLDTTAPALATSLALSNPTSSPGNVTTPTIQVNGVSTGDFVGLYADPTCNVLSQKASGTAAGGGYIQLTSSPLSPDGTFTFYAQIKDQAGNTLGCSTASVSYLLDTVPPSVPSGVTATPSSGQVALSWTASSGQGTITYNIRRSTTSGGPYTLVGSNMPGTSYNDTTVTNGTTYYYVVSALDVGGESGPSTEVLATPTGGAGLPPQGTVTLSTGTITGTSIQLSWTYSLTDQTGYTIQRSLDGSVFADIAAPSGATSSYTDPGLLAGQSYFYRIYANNAYGSSSPSSLVSATPSFTWAFVDGTGASGRNYSTTSNTGSPFVVTFNSKVYASWLEAGAGCANTANQVRVAVYGGNDVAPSWAFIDGNGACGLNANTASSAAAGVPRLVVFNSKLYLTWNELNGGVNQIRAKVYNGNDSAPGWASVDGGGANGLNWDTAKSASYARAFVFNGKLYLAWHETGGTGCAFNQVRVRVYNGNDASPAWSWVDLASACGGINVSTGESANYVDLASVNGKLYAIWSEASPTVQLVRAKVYGGNDASPSWASVDAGGLNVSSAQNGLLASLTVLNNKLYAAWYESNGTANQIHSKVYNGNDGAAAWSAIDGGTSSGLNASTSKAATNPQWITMGSYLYLTWNEPDATNSINQIRARVYNGNDTTPGWNWIDGAGAPAVLGLNKDTAKNANTPSIVGLSGKLYMIWIEGPSPSQITIDRGL